MNGQFSTSFRPIIGSASHTSHSGILYWSESSGGRRTEEFWQAGWCHITNISEWHHRFYGGCFFLFPGILWKFNEIHGNSLPLTACFKLHGSGLRGYCDTCLWWAASHHPGVAKTWILLSLQAVGDWVGPKSTTAWRESHRQRVPLLVGGGGTRFGHLAASEGMGGW